MGRLEAMGLAAYNHRIGLALDDVVVDACITKAPCGGEAAGRSPVDQGKLGLNRSVVVDANGIPQGAVAAPANRPVSPWLVPTLHVVGALHGSAATVHLDRGDDSGIARDRLAARGFLGEIAPRAPPLGTPPRPAVPSNALTPGPMPPCAERRARLAQVWLALSTVISIVHRLIRKGWARFRWDSCLARKP